MTSSKAVIVGLSACSPSFFKQVTPRLPSDRSVHKLLPSHNTLLNPEYAPSDAACSAAKNALSASGIDIGSIDFLISCSVTPDRYFPGNASSIQAKLGLNGIGCLEIKQEGVAGIQALGLAKSYIDIDQYSCILVCVSEALSRYFPEELNKLSTDKQLARAVCSDAAVACLVINQTKFKRVAHAWQVNAYESHCFFNTEDGFYLERPSAAQQPERITKEDYDLQRHIPGLQHVHYKQDYLKYLGKLGSASKQIATHQALNGCSAELASTPDYKVHDVFPKLGYVGSAGPLLAILDVQGSQNCLKGQELSVLAFGSGAQATRASLELI